MIVGGCVNPRKYGGEKRLLAGCKRRNAALTTMLQRIAPTPRQGWTLADIAKYLGISYIHMASLSNGARKISGLSIEKQRALAKFLGISMVEFFLLCGLLRQEDLIAN